MRDVGHTTSRSAGAGQGGIDFRGHNEPSSVLLELSGRRGAHIDGVNKFALLAVVVLMLPLSGQSQRQPWQLTVEERIALRTNPELARERVRGARRLQTDAANADVRSVDVFDGQTHPELFLPTEVFRSLLTLSTLGPPRTRQLFRKGLMPEVASHGLPKDFWDRLESVSTVYIADSWAERDLGLTLQRVSGVARWRTEEALALKQRDVCRSRADALAAARKEFGDARFDRFLYEAVAIHKFHSDDHLPDAAILPYVEEGCR
jgi:hypothetical protein